MNKKYLIFLGLASMLVGLVGCSHDESLSNPDREINFTKKELAFQNLTPAAPVTKTKINAYFKEKSIIPYLGVKELYTCMDGYLDASKVKSYVKGNIARFEFEKDNTTYYMELDTLNETITQNIDSFFRFYKNENPDIYDLHYKNLKTFDIKGKADDPFTYDLKPYNFNLVLKDDDVIMPYTVLSLIALTPELSHVIYNGKQFYYNAGYLMDPQAYFNIQNPELYGHNFEEEIISQRNNEIYFVLDYFYGVRDKLNNMTGKQLIENDPMLAKQLKSSKPRLYNGAIVQFLLKTLNDPHTMPGFKSFYDKKLNVKDMNMPYSSSIVGDRYLTMYQVFLKLDEMYKNLFPSTHLGMSYGSTGFIKFDSFITQVKDFLYDSNGQLKPDAYQYDSFLFMKKHLDALKKNPNIRNVVIDLSCNTGGYIDIGYACLGLLTNEDVEIPHLDGFNNHAYYQTIQSDGDLDNDFTDDDAYDQFNYYILTSPTSFSTSLMFSSTAKSLGIAKLIGQPSGGGMCGIMDVNLADGSTFSFSGNSIVPGMIINKDGTREVFNNDNGLPVDIEIPYDKFYDFKYIDEILSKI